MALAPGLEGVDDRTQALADLRQPVFDPRRHLRIDLADHEPVLLQRAKLLGQHALGNAGHPPPQFTEALCAVLQMVEDDAFPFAVDQIEGRLDRAAGLTRKISPFHPQFSL